MKNQSDVLESERLLQHRAAAGAQLLDALDEGWQWRADPEKLQMDVGRILENGCGCVLAQLDGRSFQGSINSYQIDKEAEVPLGFTLDRPDFDHTSQWDKLTVAWRAEILSRRQVEEAT